MKKNILVFAVYLCMFIFCEIILMFIVTLVSQLLEHKISFSVSLFSYDLFLHPISTLQNLIESKNPLFLIGTVFIVCYLIYFKIKTRKKNYENVGDKYAVHGSSSWLKPKDLLNNHEIVSVFTKEDLRDSLERIEIK